MDDTIVGISTTMGVGAISIVRLSGKEAIKIASKIYKGSNLKKVKSHTIKYGHIYSGDEIIDEVLVSIMKTPNTYTKEDIVEINCHGGITTTNKVLELCLTNGARLAEPGEFTKRAFLNGRIDLTQAEGVMNLINSKTEQSRKMSINQLGGSTSDQIKKLRQYLIEIIAQIEVNIDYPEYEDIEVLENEHLKPKLSKIKKTLSKIIKDSEQGKIIKEGIDTVIVGRPNVGKSSILNMLIDEEKAIVTDVAGTTRDIVEGQINLDGILINLIDTAGIRKTKNIVEKIGVDKSMQLLFKNDLVLYVVNNNEDITDEDIEILNKLNDRNYIIIINKNDLEQKLNIEKLKKYKNIVHMNTITNEGLEELKNIIKKMYNLETFDSKDMTYVTNAKSLSLLKKSLKEIHKIEEGIEKEIPIDLLEIDLKQIWSNLGEITGETLHDELIDQLFNQFCLGK